MMCSALGVWMQASLAIVAAAPLHAHAHPASPKTTHRVIITRQALPPRVEGPWGTLLATPYVSPDFLQDDVTISLRRRLPFDGGRHHHSAWRLGLQASALAFPGDRAATVHIKRRGTLQAVRLGVESWENELLPTVYDPTMRRRVVRRVGPALSWELKHHARGPWRRLRPGVCVHAGARLWPLGDGNGPSLDARGEISGLWQKQRSSFGPRVWGRASWRGLLGHERPNLRLSGWEPAVGPAARRARRPLTESILGYEDLQRYARQLAQVQGGFGWLWRNQVHAEIFVAASHAGAENTTRLIAQAPLRRALGLAFAKTWYPRGRALTMTYQIAHRFDAPREPQLHLLAMSL